MALAVAFATTAAAQDPPPDGGADAPGEGGEPEPAVASDDADSSGERDAPASSAVADESPATRSGVEGAETALGEDLETAGVAPPPDEDEPTSETVPEEALPEAYVDDPPPGEAYDDLPDLLVFGPTTFSLTNTTRVDYWGDDFDDDVFDDEFFAITERVELAMQGTELRLQARLDLFLPIYLDDTCDTTPGIGQGNDDAAVGDEMECARQRDSRFDIRPERITLHWQRGPWSLDLGDSRMALGRGIPLSLRLDDILGIDLALRGAQVGYDSGTDFYFKAAGGLANPQNLDPITRTIVSDPGDILAATEVGYRFGDRQELDVGVQGTFTDFGVRPSPGLLRKTGRLGIAGVHASTSALLDGRLTLYGEYNHLWRNDQFVNTDDEITEEDRRQGRAVYAQAQWQVENNFSLLFEWKDYREFQNAVRVDETLDGNPVPQYQYSVLPALERDEERLRATYNARGGRVQADYGFFPGDWSVAGNALVYGHAEDVDVDPWDGILVTHGYFEIQKANNEIDPDVVGWALDLIGGYRRETYLQGVPALSAQRGDLDWEVIHGIVDGTLVAGDHSIALRVQHRIEKRREAVEFDEYVRGEAVMTYSYRGIIRFSPALRWNTELPDAPPIYPGFDVRWDFAPGSFLRVFGGRTPGGLVCSNGVCREVPPFEGGSLELIVRL